MSSMIDAMRLAGLAPHKELILTADGRLRRYRVEGDKPGSANGWAVLHEGAIQSGAFGSWKTGAVHTWRQNSDRRLSAAERQALRQQQAAAQQARAAEQRQVQAQAAQRAERLWQRARPATDAHPYLAKKRVRAIGLRQLRDMLMVPARDTSGRLSTLQFIGPDGTKRFLTGGRIQGCYCAMGRPSDCLLVCEGYATGATIFAATGQAVAVCFNCGNMLPVAQALRRKFPALRLIVCADNDAGTPGNPGLTHARAAARAVGGEVVAPDFAGVPA
ncbi:MAG: toprim domain-containing protein [Burkholderiales bacterium]|uniref:toprim domain-containing protein n=1 Tax=Ottowia sp. TaxID=1898956 RepID=UPI001ACA95C3|nr:toprim domain-containing protein [Ottowia sp.]MBN9403974.1 toprim domain-containing protein [Burkholderiales bacterium]MBS0403158.1 toprim domain-containing protein [Pseudomonadota bacterium]MBS0413984.1 toprim domain-containing protein [Pseudomonadota bacterium]